MKGKNILALTEKYYAGDIGLRNVIKSSEQIDNNKLYENIVYLEILRRGYDVKEGKLDDTLKHYSIIDFLISDNF